MLGYEHALRALKSGNGQGENGLAELQDHFRRMAARGAASTVLALAENLPKIVDNHCPHGSRRRMKLPHSHSIVPGGFEVTS
jgi:hypothetical protein